MQIKDLPPTILAALKKRRYDRFIEKHEGPFRWESQLDRYAPKTLERIESYKKNNIEYDPESDAEFLQIGGADVLLPVSADHHPNLTILHHFFSEDRSKIVCYLKDTTYDDSEWGAGYVAICDRFEGQDFYFATFYHEWFMIDYDPLADRWRKEPD